MAKATTSKPKEADEGKTMAIIAYLTWIGLLIAFIMNNEKKNKLAKFHIRQALMIMLACVAAGFVMIVPILGWLVGFAAYIALFVFWVMGLISAINGVEKEVPIIGKLAQEWFKGL